MADHHNEGVEISNSTVSGPVAGGYAASAQLIGSSTATSAAVTAAERVLDDLQALILANTAAVTEVAFALQDIADIRAELHSPAPDQRRLRDMIRQLLVRVAPVLSAAALVMDVRSILGL
jgi:hypothetical protein